MFITLPELLATAVGRSVAEEMRSLPVQLGIQPPAANWGPISRERSLVSPSATIKINVSIVFKR